MKKKCNRDPLTISKIMTAIKSKGTKPELTVREIIRSLGYRYCAHPKEIPGKPDIVFKKKKKVIFVNGCFWHHHGCSESHLPSSRREYWVAKFRRNKLRDKSINYRLRKNGWRVFTVWECKLKNVQMVKNKLAIFLH